MIRTRAEKQFIMNTIYPAERRPIAFTSKFRAAWISSSAPCIAAHKTDPVSGKSSAGTTRGNPPALFRNTSDTRTLNSGIPVKADAAWNTGTMVPGCGIDRKTSARFSGTAYFVMKKPTWHTHPQGTARENGDPDTVHSAYTAESRRLSLNRDPDDPGSGFRIFIAPVKPMKKQKKKTAFRQVVDRSFIRTAWLLAITMCSWTFAQMLRPVARQVQDYHDRRVPVQRYHLFTPDNDTGKHSGYRKAATDITVIKLVPGELKRLLHEKPDFIEITFPYRETSAVTVELYRHRLTTADFLLTTETGKALSYTPGVYYQGIIKGEPGSVAAFSFFSGNIMGVASSPSSGNIVLGKTKDASDYVSYTDTALTGKNPFACAADIIPEGPQGKAYADPAALKDNEAKVTEKCIRIYYEIGYKAYQNNGSDVYATADWLSGIHNNIATLYYNDGIKISLNEIRIWTTPDPYTGTYSDNLADFRTNRQVFNGDLAHLVNWPATTSIAYVNSLCTTYRYAYSAVDQTYPQIPVYSWTIHAMTHEMGHSFGSPHTHACAWNGNNTAIDGCGPLAGANEGCNGPVPASGTIMSYCHLVSAGVNFSNGFGPQPAALMRNIIDSKTCIGTNCTSGCAAAGNIVPNTAFVSGDINSCTTWGNPPAILRNIQDTKTVNTGVTVTANENWSTKAMNLVGTGAIQFPASHILDFTTDQGADKSCGCP